ncbi:MAG: hypothetical protein ACHQ50_11505 [Fimbriimonadales bacterium]
MTKRELRKKDLTRRDFLVGAIGLCTVGSLLDGCGGGGIGGGFQGGLFTGSAILPAGVAAANATVVSGLGSSALTGGNFSLTAPISFPTLASIVDSVSGNVVLLGMLDPGKNRQTLDAANCAATLTFLALGGSQLPPNGRALLFATIQSNAANSTLAGVISTRLAADPFALVNGDNAIKTALATAVAAFPPGPRPVSAPSNGGPRVVQPTFTVHGTVNEGSFQAPYNVAGSSEPVIAVNSTLREVQFSMFYVGSTAPNGVRTDLPSALSVLSFQEIPRSSAVDGQGHLQFGQFSFNVSPHTTGNNDDFFGLVRLTPIFDAPDPAFFTDPRYNSNVAVWRVVLEDMFARAQVQVVAQFIIEAMGLGCITNTAVMQLAVTAFDAIGASEHGLIQTARQGTALKATTLQFLLNLTASNAAAQAYIDAVQSAFHYTLPANAAIRLLNLRGNVLIFQALGVLDSSILLGEFIQSLTETQDAFGNPVAVGFLNEADYSFSGLVITPVNAQYLPGGPTLQISIPSSYNDVPFTIEWILSGANAIIDDGHGNSGTDFKTKYTTVTLTTTPSTAGTLIVTCNVILKSTGQVVATAKSTITQIIANPTGSIIVNAVQNAGIDPNIGAWTLYGAPSQTSITMPNAFNNYKFGLTFGQVVYGKYPGSATVKPGVFNYGSGDSAVSIIGSTGGVTGYTQGQVINIPPNGLYIGEVANQSTAQLTITSVNGKTVGFSINCLLYNPGDTTFAPDATFQFNATGTFTTP